MKLDGHNGAVQFNIPTNFGNLAPSFMLQHWKSRYPTLFHLADEKG